jgi:hypothetical protein
MGSGAASGSASGSGVARMAMGKRRRVRIEEGCILYGFGRKKTSIIVD